MLKYELLNVLAVFIILLAATLLLTEGEAEDWRFTGYFFVAYLMLATVQWVWRSRRRK